MCFITTITYALSLCPHHFSSSSSSVAGMNMQNVRFLWASEEINAHAEEYWSTVMDIARVNNLPRIQRCCTIMGRKDTEEVRLSLFSFACHKY
jgi:hypothetical protein